jgi:preprotein translocase subunit SecG
MLAFVIVLQVLVALFLIMVVLLQPGNRGGASAALGGAGSDTVFGARGANTFLSKITFGAAVLFMGTNFALSFMSMNRNNSVLDMLETTPSATEKKPEQEKEDPAVNTKNEAVDPATAPVENDGAAKEEDDEEQVKQEDAKVKAE